MRKLSWITYLCIGVAVDKFAEKTLLIPYSQKYWWESSKFGRLASTGVNIKLANFNLADSAAGIRCMQCHDLILTDFNLVVGLSIRQTAKLNFSPTFPAIW